MNKQNRQLELLAPAGNSERLKTALHFGADAVYFAGKNFGLRAFADNFTDNEIAKAVALCHEKGARAYIALNIFAHNADFNGRAFQSPITNHQSPLKDYLEILLAVKADAVIVSDAGIFDFVKENAPNLPIHISTQANVTNLQAARFWARQGAARIVLARELSCGEIREIRDGLDPSVRLEAFVHGAMCISYSGRCLLSNYLSNRDGNRGECVQVCRWEYSLFEKERPNEPLTMREDGRGTYIMNSRDLNTLAILDKLIECGIESFKIEGRVKTSFYVGSVVNAYRRALDLYQSGGFGLTANKAQITALESELNKTGSRGFTRGFYNVDSMEKKYKSDDTPHCSKSASTMQNYETSKPVQESIFTAVVLGYDKKRKSVLIEQRNRFKIGDTLEIVSPKLFGKSITVNEMSDLDGNPVSDALLVQQKLYVKTDIELQAGDILRFSPFANIDNILSNLK